MKSKRVFVICITMILLLLGGCKKEEKEKKLLIMAAASMTDVTKELQKEYEKENNNVKLEFSYGSSGALMNQIKEGAPADVFISASVKQMNELDGLGLLKKDSVVNLLENKIVLVVPKDSTKNITGFDDIIGKADYIALGEPKSVPVGQYSKELFETLGIYEEIKEITVYGSDVRGVLAYVESQNADCAVVYATDALISEKVKVVAEADNLTTKIIYPAGIIKDSQNTEEAESFIEFLESDKAMKIFEKYGFSKGN